MLAKALPGSAGPSGPHENNSDRLSRRLSGGARLRPLLRRCLPPAAETRRLRRTPTRRGFTLRIVAALVVSTGFAAVAGSAFADDAAHGAQLAQQWCMGCHILPDHPGQTALQGPPSFRELARNGKTLDQLRVFLLQPHGAMPPLTLSRAEIDDLLGYIATLR